MGQRRNQFICRVGENTLLCRDHYRLKLVLDHFGDTRPGQFIQISCRDLSEHYSPEHESTWQAGHRLDVAGRELMTPLAFLRRPFSLAGRKNTGDGRVELHVIHRVVGIGTEWLGRLVPDDQVYILGPLGNAFELPADNQEAILVAGGVGIPPMLYLAEALSGRNAIAFCGALTRDLLPLTILQPSTGRNAGEDDLNIAEFARHGVRSAISTDDGSYGFRGLVTQALELYLDEGSGVRNQGSAIPVPTPRPRPLAPIIYTCGPEPMMKRVAEIAAARNIECQVAVERAMACGMGTCQSCVIRVRKAEPATPPLSGHDWCYRLACTDGPVFRGADLLW